MRSDVKTHPREASVAEPSMDATGAPAAARVLRNEDSSMERVLDLLSNIMETGDLDGVDHWLDVMAAELAGMENERQKERLRTLRTVLNAGREREAAFGGPGRLFDAQHPFAVMTRRLGERTRLPIKAGNMKAGRPGGHSLDCVRMRVIERELDIGDSAVASMNLERWGKAISLCLDTSLHIRLERSKARLENLLAYEAIHGQLSLLDFHAPEVLKRNRIAGHFY